MSQNKITNRASASQRAAPARQKKDVNVAGQKLVSPGRHLINSNNADGSYYDNKDFGSLWLTEFLSYETSRNESIAKADLMKFTKLPGSTVHPQAAKHLYHKSKCGKAKPPSGTKLSDEEKQRLNELSKTLLGKKGKKNVGSKKGTKFTPYVESNTKISRVLQHTKLKTNTENMKASQLDEFYKLVSIETNAAIRLQSQCRRVLATKIVRRLALVTKMATKLQSHVRRLLALRLLQRMQEERRNALRVRERFVRVYIARYRRRKRIEFEHKSAILCQSGIRMFFAKSVLRLKQLQFSWELNQIRWRALSTRIAWKDLRTNFHARQIQRVVRRILARKRFDLIFTVNTEAAVCIQSIWRRYAAQQQKQDMEYQRRVERQSDKIRIIASERQYWKQQVEELRKPDKIQLRNQLEDQKSELEKKQEELKQQIIVLESHYRDQIQAQQRITPRSIAGGWEEQVKKNLRDTRERLTTAKLDLLFGVQKKLKQVEKQLGSVISKEEEAKSCVDHWSHWHQIEQDKLWDLQRQHDREVEMKAKQHDRVDGQMRWAVKFYMPSGKPDKRKRLFHYPSTTSDVAENGDKVQQLMEKVKLNADKIQTHQHLAFTFRPFLNICDQLEAFVAGNGSTIFSQNKENKVKRNRSMPMVRDVMKDRPTTGQSAISSHAHECSDDTACAFPMKLPWALLHDAKREREEILEKFAPPESYTDSNNI